MKYASVCSGVEAASLAWLPIGWEPVWFSEIEPFPSEVLRAHFPGVQNLGDMTKIKGENYHGTVDLLVGGTPCQGFSVAGKQGGLDDPRSALCLAYCRLLETMRPRWFVWENVPGAFSTNGGADFREFLRKIDAIGYSVAWRVDGYPRAVPQRRRRVFVVGHSSGDWRYPASVLFEPGCLPGDTPPRRVKGEGVARSLAASTGGASGIGRTWDLSGVNPTLNQSSSSGTIGSSNQELFSQNANGLVIDICTATGQANAETATDCCVNLTCNHEAPIVCQYGDVAGTLTSRHDSSPCADRGMNIVYENHAQDCRVKACGECSPQINAKAGTGSGNLPLVLNKAVRRLTPVECERLMGFPDNWTRLSWRGKTEGQCPDSPRYKACGNSMCVNVMRWIGMRIEYVEREMGRKARGEE